MFHFLLLLLMLTLIGTFLFWLWAVVGKKTYRNRIGTALLLLIVIGLVSSQCSYMFLTEPLIDAAGDGDQAKVQQLLTLGADVNSVGDDGRGTALFQAVSGNHPEIVQTLIRHGADVNKTGNYSHHDTPTPLRAAARHPEISAMLKQAGAQD